PSHPASTLRPSPASAPFPYTTLFRSCPTTRLMPKASPAATATPAVCAPRGSPPPACPIPRATRARVRRRAAVELPPPRSRGFRRSEEHTSELQSRENLVCRLRLEKNK